MKHIRKFNESKINLLPEFFDEKILKILEEEYDQHKELIDDLDLISTQLQKLEDIYKTHTIGGFLNKICTEDYFLDEVEDDNDKLSKLIKLVKDGEMVSLFYILVPKSTTLENTQEAYSTKTLKLISEYTMELFNICSFIEDLNWDLTFDNDSNNDEYILSFSPNK